MPIIQNLLFAFDDNGVTITGTDLQTTVKTRLEGFVNPEGGSFAVNTKTLLDLLKSVTGPLEFTFSSNALKVKGNQGKYEIGCLSGADFPLPPEEKEGDKNLTIKGYILDQAISLTSGCVSTDELRPVMTGVCFDLNNGNVVATNGHKLSQYNTDLRGEGELIIPTKPLSVIKGLQDEDVHVTYNHANAIFNTKDFTVYFRLVDGKYPPYEKVIPQNNDKMFFIEKDRLVETLKRVSLFSNNDSKQIKFILNGGGSKVVTNDANYGSSASEKLAGNFCKNDENRSAIETDFEIGFNAKYLLELLATQPEGIVDMTFSEASRPVLLYNSQNQKLTQLVMPVVLN